ncbi:hypothetical protein CULCOIPH002_11490 [Corynebacterium ulcerans]|uniref:Uncharacterized protein n=1 Tax=Corynebacterium ulcerans TaxID=65058 RepID=A0ABD0BHC0_CORUL|nr:hypothetical protein CULCOIPH001_07630 [Corynebacterium ulcerans]GJJ36237.1 hypothetical protein CULCOIPH002_11490 [Corynebacterium ulcerans]GJJ38572.1 hypothetical protein CULCOIPH003_12030 [Corynebacterium ulcerans]GJJ40279.1 hypothetical protein CULCOIPH004_06900 [Corynebacterium ulcerans]GJJ41905.1 hypothetical protein CULCOIPH005_00940 [Corynebacterium ulcerans]
MNLALLDVNDAHGRDSAPLSALPPHRKISVAGVDRKPLIALEIVALASGTSIRHPRSTLAMKLPRAVW